jgi:hypothetical protein
MKRIAGVYIAWLVVAILLVFAAVGRHPYSFYTLLRLICCPVFAYSAFAAHERKRVLWVWIFGVLAALYNPIFRIQLDRSTWTAVNWFTVGAIAVAAASFAPRGKESTMSAAGDKIQTLHVSRRVIAREWLIFLTVLPLGFATCFFLGYYRLQPTGLIGAYDTFWNKTFGLGSPSSVGLWLLPYLALTLIRSILWSVGTLWRGRSLRRETLYSLLVVYLIAAFFFGTLLVANVQREAANRAAASWYFDPTTSTLIEAKGRIALYDRLLKYLGGQHPVSVEIPKHGVATFPDNKSPDEVKAIIQRYFFPSPGLDFEPVVSAKDGFEYRPYPRGLTDEQVGLVSPTPAGDIFDRIAASKVAANDLNKIALFDLGVEEGPQPFLQTAHRERSIVEFHGRVRNELPRAVERVVIKVYIYNTPGELIETRKFRLYQRAFEPSAPASFSAFESIRHLPEHYFYQFQVDEAQYTQ